MQQYASSSPYVTFSLALASLIIEAHCLLLVHCFRSRFAPSFLKPSSTSFIHTSLGRPLPLERRNPCLSEIRWDVINDK